MKRNKRCFTRSQWNSFDDAHGAEARKMLEDSIGK